MNALEHTVEMRATSVLRREEALAEAQQRRDDAIVAAVAGGVSVPDVARRANLTERRVRQILPQPAVVTRRQVRPYQPKATGFVDGFDELAWLLEESRRAGFGRVMVTGDRRRVQLGNGNETEKVRAYFVQELPPAWRPAPNGHHLADIDNPIGRYVHESGHTVEVMRAATWMPAGWDASRCSTAWAMLSSRVAESFDGAVLLTTPGTTGRDLWLRTVRRDGYQVIPEERREWIRETAGQGRVETFGTPTAWKTVEAWDARLYYAALTFGLPVGPPTYYHTGPDYLDSHLNMRGRWRATVMVPRSVRLPLGLLGVNTGSGWEYPTKGAFTGVWDAVELRLAISYGYRVTLLDGMTQREGKPLDEWRNRLVRIYSEHPDMERPVRAMILHTIGGFAAVSATVTRVGTPREADAANTVSGVSPLGETGLVTWQEVRADTSYTDRMRHPEWSATIWARGRARIAHRALQATTDGWHVLGIRTDALYLGNTRGGTTVPFERSERVGELRLKGRAEGSYTVRNSADLLKLREVLGA